MEENSQNQDQNNNPNNNLKSNSSQSVQPVNVNADTASTPPSKPSFKTKLLEKVKPIYEKIDLKASKLFPNPKLRKIMILFVAGFIALFVFLLILGLITVALQPKDTSYTLNKPTITQPSATPEKPKTEVQNKLMDLKQEVNDLSFPPNKLTAPEIETEISI